MVVDEVSSIIQNNYVVKRIVDLSYGQYRCEEICEIIGSERSLERVILWEDVKNYIEKLKEQEIIYVSAGIVYRNEEKYLEIKNEWEDKNTNGITRILWDLTRKCNLKCKHCYAYKESNYFEELDLKQIYQTVEDLKSLQPYLIVYGGGEPLVRNDFLDILKYTKEVLKCRIKVLTNGTLLTHNKIRKIKPYVDFVQVSIDGSEKSHDELRGQTGAYRKAIKAIKLLREEDIQTGICMTIHNENYEDIDEIVEFSLRHGIYKLRVSPFVSSGKANDNYKDWMIPKEKLIEVYTKLARYKMLYRKKLLFDFRDELYGDAFLGYSVDKTRSNNDYLLCAAGRSMFYINPEGYVTPCNFIDKEEFFVGNVKEQNVADIWNDSELFKEYRMLDVTKIDKCSVCKRKSVCGGGLRCNALMITGNLRAVDPCCNFFEEECS